MANPAPVNPTPQEAKSPNGPARAELSSKFAGKSVQHLYRVIQKSSGAVGGYGHNGPVYGEVTMGTFQKVVDALCEHTGFDASSAFVDIGSGLGKPNLHVALNPGVRLSYGVELEELRWQLSMHNLRFVLNEVPEMRKSVVYFANSDATDMDHFEPFTHVYMFDVGFPPAVLVALANAFNLSKTVQALVSFQRPDKVISVYGFAVDLITQVATRMSGSTEKHTAYVYRAKQNAGIKAKPRRQLQLDSNFFVSKTGKDKVSKTGKDKVSKTDKDTVDKSPKKAGNALTVLQLEEYNSWVTNTGVIGAPGERPQRTAARKRL